MHGQLNEMKLLLWMASLLCLVAAGVSLLLSDTVLLSLSLVLGVLAYVGYWQVYSVQKLLIGPARRR